jgi:hypothetical protein
MEKKKNIYYKGRSGNITGLATGANLRTPPKVLPFSQFVKWKMSLNISIGW